MNLDNIEIDESNIDNPDIIGVLIGDTGKYSLTIALKNSFGARRGELVRILHKEYEDIEEQWVLAKITEISRKNILYDEAFGSEVAELTILGENLENEKVLAKMELIGYRDPLTGEIRNPRRALEPGSKIYKVDNIFLKYFYRYNKESSIKLGYLVGYERGDNKVPIYLDINTIATEHLAILAMTGAGKSYTIGRIIEHMAIYQKASVIIFDPHGEYGSALKNGEIQFSGVENIPHHYQEEIYEIQAIFKKKMEESQNIIQVFAPKTKFSDIKYQGHYNDLSLRLDILTYSELRHLLPNMSDPQERIFRQVHKHWLKKFDTPRDPNDLINLLGRDFENFKNSIKKASPSEISALNKRSASILAMNLRNFLSEQIFWERGREHIDLKKIIGTKAIREGRIIIFDFQSIDKQVMQAAVAIICNQLLEAVQNQVDPIRPAFVIFEEGHLFAPAKEASISRNVIKKMAAEGRKFGIGLCILSQRPKKLDPDVTSQCNTFIMMRIKNPDDQKFVKVTSDYISQAELNEIPALSTGEALICGRAIISPLLVKIGPKALKHGGQTPDVCKIWRGE